MTDVEIPDGSTWEHKVSGKRCTVLGSNEHQLSVRYERCGGFGIIWGRSRFLQDFRPADRPPKPTPVECWAVPIPNPGGGWWRYHRKADAESVASLSGGRWIAPVVPRMDEAVWVPGVES